MAPTTQAQNTWVTSGGDDFLQLQKTNGGGVLGGIDATGKSYGSLVPPITSNGLQTAKITLSSAQLLTFATTPVDFIPAPGANKVVYIMGLVAKYIPKTAVYVVSSSNRIVINSASCIASGSSTFNFYNGASFIAPSGVVDGSAGATIGSVIYNIPAPNGLTDVGVALVNSTALLDETAGPGQINQPFQIMLGDITTTTPTNMTSGNGTLMIVALYQIIDLS
jgi:hypothetical protein